MDLETNTHQDHAMSKGHTDDLAHRYQQTHSSAKRYMIRLHKWADERHMHLHPSSSHIRAAAASSREMDSTPCQDPQLYALLEPMG